MHQIYREKVTARTTTAASFFKMLDDLAAGDVVTVRRIDASRAAPSTCSPSALGPPPGGPAVAASGDQRRTHRNLVEMVYPGSIASRS